MKARRGTIQSQQRLSRSPTSPKLEPDDVQNAFERSTSKPHIVSCWCESQRNSPTADCSNPLIVGVLVHVVAVVFHLFEQVRVSVGWTDQFGFVVILAGHRDFASAAEVQQRVDRCAQP